MKRIITSIITIVLLFNFSMVSSASEGGSVADVIDSNIIINEQKITSSNMRFEILTINNQLYYPISHSSLDAVGYSLNWDADTRSIILNESHENGFISNGWRDVNTDNKYVISETDVILNNNSLSSEKNPVYEVNDVLYIALNKKNLDLLGWYYTWSDDESLVIDTKSKASLDDYVASMRSSEDIKIANFMQSVNKNLSKDEANKYVKLINESTEKYSVDKYWFISMMWVESNFDKNCEYKGANGLMQIMTSTGRSLGLTKEQLYIPEYSIEYSVKYLKGNINRYNGNMKKAVSAYNQGTGNVDRGSYSTWYVGVVEKRMARLKAYIK